MSIEQTGVIFAGQLPNLVCVCQNKYIVFAHLFLDCFGNIY